MEGKRRERLLRKQTAGSQRASGGNRPAKCRKTGPVIKLSRRFKIDGTGAAKNDRPAFSPSSAVSANTSEIRATWPPGQTPLPPGLRFARALVVKDAFPGQKSQLNSYLLTFHGREKCGEA